MNIFCKGCGKDSGIRDAEGSCSINDMSQRTGFAWIASVAGESLWLCRECAFEIEGHLSRILDLMGKTYVNMPILQANLKRYLGSLAHQSKER